MTKKETKEKLKNIPGKSLEELVKEGELDEFAHLQEIGDEKKEDNESSS